MKPQRCGLCGQRSGERRCPTLERWICSACCGKERGRTVRCFPACPYLTEAEARWRARRSRELAEAWAIWQKTNPELPWPYIRALAEILAAFLHRTFATDIEVEQALSDLDQALSPIILVSKAPSALGKTLSSALVPLAQEGKVDPGELRTAVKALKDWVSRWRIAEDDRRFVRALLGTFPPPSEEPTLIIRP
ncbi:MAG: hypothetical protein NZ651_05100 [Candidatus Bipolaricaulota bacterium]|nr:hypothetical protein [Candidatus Bipolaricaulota bacterium]MDW8127131.1 hypothetical protein [Candidatus Bipolaricaulota bacterium]